MCGISLVYSTAGVTPAAACLEKMNRALLHRGPDAQAVLCRSAVGMGHTRLSIVDVAGGAQPMETPDRTWAIVFNGEIYNYRALRAALEKDGVEFVTHSDTEVVLHLVRRERERAVLKLRGMFAFAVHCADDNSVYIARDRLGIKPLFYAANGATVVVASECKALFASGSIEPRLDAQSVRNYFTYQFAVPPYTVFEGVLELEPGHQMVLRQGAAPQVSKYWDLEFPRDGEYESDDGNYWDEKFSAALHDAAATHTIGDVPIGSYLSGGIDSATTTWLMTQHYDRPVQSFSIHFTNTGMDESLIYRNIAAHLRVANDELTMHDERPEGFLAELEACVYHLEQPQRMAVDIPHFMLSDLVRRKKYKVVYTGDGADEILAGYDCFRQDMMRIWANAIPDPGQRREQYLNVYTRDFSQEFVRMIMALHEPEAQRQTIARYGFYPVWFDFWYITTALLPGLFTPDFARSTGNDPQMQHLIETLKPHVEGRHRINQSLYLETKTRLPGWILWKSDRLSMAHSVEARVPFMDHPLVELAARMPPDLKLDGMNEKYILKKVAQPHLPKHPTQFKKRAFYTPIREWFFTRARRPELERYLSKAALADCGMFDVARVHQMWDELMMMGTPVDGNAYFRMMQREWVLMVVLTVQILHAQYVRKQAPCFA